VPRHCSAQAETASGESTYLKPSDVTIFPCGKERRRCLNGRVCLNISSADHDKPEATRLTRRSVLLKRGVRGARWWHPINVHGFLPLQPPSFTVLFLPFAFLSEYGLQVLGPPVLVLRVFRVFERFGDMEIRELLDKCLCNVFSISCHSMPRTRTRVHTGVDAPDPSAFFLKPPFGGLLIIEASCLD
jgi:hypothetical protein